MRNLVRWCLSGFITIVIIGGLSHFVYSWSGECEFVGAFAPVNESVWEHLKMGYWGVLIFSVFEYSYVGRSVGNYFLAKAAGITILSITILSIYYSYTFFTTSNILVIDISAFIIGVLCCQFVVYRLFKKPLLKSLAVPALIYIVVLGFIFAFFTFYPPRHDIFKDMDRNTYGIENYAVDSAKSGTNQVTIDL